MSVSAYTTQAKIESRLSSSALTLRTDDGADAGEITALIDDAIADASVEVYGYLGTLYSDTSLAQSQWVSKKATDIAVVYVCQRRGNPVPKSLKVVYDKAIADLERAMAGAWIIPDAALRKANSPVLSNQGVVLRPQGPRVVTQKTASTGNPEGYSQPRDPTDFVDPASFNTN